MCEVFGSGENGEILFYNVGNRYGFAFCKRCGRAAVETAPVASSQNLPRILRPGHNRLWGGEQCEANEHDIARQVVFTGKHPTCYSVLRFKKNTSSSHFEADEQLVYSLGVIIRRTLAKLEGIDEGEIDFGVKQEQDGYVLFVYDVAKGGCGYSLRLSDQLTCQKVFDAARAELEATTCRCHETGGACAKCLIDRTNYRFANKLSKGKVLEWLRLQASSVVQVTSAVRSFSPSAKIVYQSLKDLLKEAIRNTEVTELTLCASDLTDDYSVQDWCSYNSEMGHLIHNAIASGKRVKIRVEYHPELHDAPSSKLPFLDIDSKFVDCDVELVKDMGAIKTGLLVTRGGETTRYFIDNDNAISFSNNWGADYSYVFADNQATSFEREARPTYVQTPSEIVRQGLTDATSFVVRNYFSAAIAPALLRGNDKEVLTKILKGKRVNIWFSDMYVNSALASLMLVYLIKEMKEIFEFEIDNVMLQLDSPKRKCNNTTFNDYNSISYNFENKEDADAYTERLFDEVLDVDVDFSPSEDDHHRWLRISTDNGGMVEIRPDHGISGGYYTYSKYMNLDTLNGSVRVNKRNEDVLYYIVIKQPKQ